MTARRLAALGFGTLLIVVPGVALSLRTDGASTIAPACSGSSNPTFWPSNHRVVTTRRGRELVVYDPHGSGVTLAWRDTGTGWRQRSIFSNQDDDVNNDRPASIALDGQGGAWVAWAGYEFDRPSAVKMLRLRNLDARDGPKVGPLVTVEPVGLGSVFGDLAFQQGRGTLVWSERSEESEYELVTASFDPSSSTPRIIRRTVLYEGTSPYISGTLVSMRSGVRVVARAGDLSVFVQNSSGAWRRGAVRVEIPKRSKPSAAAFDGDIVIAFQSKPYNDDVVRVVRLSSNGDSVRNLFSSTAGFAHPALTAGTGKVWLMMVRRTDNRAVVSRTFNGSRWGRSIVRVGRRVTDGGDYAWPNTTRRTRRILRFIVDGRRCPTSTQANSVVFYRKTL